MSFWIDNKTCNCNSDEKKTAGTVDFEGTTYCKFCRCKRGSSTTTSSAIPTLDDTPYDYLASSDQNHDKPFAYDNSRHNPQPRVSNNTQSEGKSESTSEVPRIDKNQIGTASVWRFRYITGLKDPVLWIGTAMWAIGAIQSGIRQNHMRSEVYFIDLIFLALTIVPWILTVSLVRWPISAFLRQQRLGREEHKIDFNKEPHWQADPARLGAYRWYENGWTKKVTGSRPRPSATTSLLLALLLIAIVIATLIALFLVTNQKGQQSRELASNSHLTKSLENALEAKVAYGKALRNLTSTPYTASNYETTETKLKLLTTANNSFGSNINYYGDSLSSELEKKLTQVHVSIKESESVGNQALAGLRTCAGLKTYSAFEACIRRLDSRLRPIDERANTNLKAALANIDG